MAGLIDQLRQRVEQSRRELEDAKRKTQLARFVEETLAAEASGYERALAAEERREGKTSVAPPEAKTTAGGESPINKTDFADEFINSRNGSGVTAPEVYRAFVDAGITVHRNYVYSILDRLVTRGRIRERRGRYLPSAGNAESEA
jgi:hypothetical protein